MSFQSFDAIAERSLRFQLRADRLLVILGCAALAISAVLGVVISHPMVP